MWFFLALLLAGCGSLARAADAVPERRVALVIGNSSYRTSPLKNPVNDARAVGRALRELGFEVLLHEDLSQPAFISALRDFGNRLRETKGVGLFYYAGHGMQIKGSNYLVPVGTDIQAEDEVRYLSIDANQVVDKMEQAGNRLNIVILDACRDNPFARSFRSKQTGLAQMDAPSGMLIAFATAPGAVAYDGDGVNGVYTKHLLRNLAIEGLPVELLLKRVREGVARETEQKQIPWESSSLLGDFYFKVPTRPTSAQSDDPAGTFELAFWDSIKNSNMPEDFNAYLEKYPEGQFAALARNRRGALLARPAAASSPGAQVAAAAPTIASVAAPGNPVRAGDRFVYQIRLGGRRLPGTLNITVSAVSGDRIEERLVREGARSFEATRTFRAGFDPLERTQQTTLPDHIYLVEFSPYVAAAGIPVPGKEWEAIPVEINLGGIDSERLHRIELTVRAVQAERIRVPAGEFNTVRIEAQTSTLNFSWKRVSVRLTYWYSTEMHRVVKINRRLLSTFGSDNEDDTFELASYQPGN
jgi:hypothetical protein